MKNILFMAIAKRIMYIQGFRVKLFVPRKNEYTLIFFCYLFVNIFRNRWFLYYSFDLKRMSLALWSTFYYLFSSFFTLLLLYINCLLSKIFICHLMLILLIWCTKIDFLFKSFLFFINLRLFIFTYSTYFELI